MEHVKNIPELAAFFSERGVYIPIATADFPTGFLIALAGSTIEQLNEHDLLQLRQICDILAIGLPTINLFEAISNNQAISMYTREIERQRLAAEIHDGPLQDLLILGRKIDHRQELNDVAKRLREICHRLYNPIMDDAIEFIAKDLVYTFSDASFKIHLIIRDGVTEVRVLQKAKLAFSFVLKEALSNIVKHTKAKNVLVVLAIEGVQLKVTISDDGGGVYDADAIPKRYKGEHQGISNMEYWASVADGKLLIDSNSDGWCVHLTLPMISDVDVQGGNDQ